MLRVKTMDRQELVARMVVGVKIVRTSMEENKVRFMYFTLKFLNLNRENRSGGIFFLL
jgi:hypothetical protein